MMASASLSGGTSSRHRARLAPPHPRQRRALALVPGHPPRRPPRGGGQQPRRACRQAHRPGRPDGPVVRVARAKPRPGTQGSSAHPHPLPARWRGSGSRSPFKPCVRFSRTRLSDGPRGVACVGQQPVPRSLLSGAPRPPEGLPPARSVQCEAACLPPTAPSGRPMPGKIAPPAHGRTLDRGHEHAPDEDRPPVPLQDPDHGAQLARFPNGEDQDHDRRGYPER